MQSQILNENSADKDNRWSKFSAERICSAGTNMLEVVELFRKMENLRKDVWIDEIITNFNVFQREDMLLRPN